MNCEYFKSKHCSSCSLLDLSYENSVLKKEKDLASLFTNFDVMYRPSVFLNDNLMGSRNKSKLVVSLLNEEIYFGFIDQSQEFKTLENCPIQNEELNKVLPDIKELLKKHKIAPYNIDHKKGELKYLILTYSETTDELLVRFVLRSKESLERLSKLASELILIRKNIIVVTANIQSEHKAIHEGEVEIVLSERSSIIHKFDDINLYQGPKSFFQTNSKIARALYQTLQEELAGKKIRTLLDLYCGVGAFSFYSQKHCEKVIGIEISSDAIGFANESKKEKKLLEIDFIADDVESYLENTNLSDIDAVIVNPPRRGLNPNIIDRIIRLAPEYIFYSSCNAKSMSRDYAQLEQSYTPISLQLFDMFPFTDHYETLGVLSKI